MRTAQLDDLSTRVVDPHADVETMYIIEFLKAKGYSLAALAGLPAETAKALMEEASSYASLKLAELETGAAFVGAIHTDESMTPRLGITVTTTEQ
jgi:hypothetical protein